MAKTTGMGRGLSAILSVSAPQEGEAQTELRSLPVELIAPNPRQPRKHFDQESLAALASSCRPAGSSSHPRAPARGGLSWWRRAPMARGAARWSGQYRLWCTTTPMPPRSNWPGREHGEDSTRGGAAVAALVEELGLTREQVGTRCGRSRVAVSNLLRLLDLPDDVLTLLEDGSLTEGHGRALLLADDHNDRRRLARTAAQEGWSVRVTEARARGAKAATSARPAAGRAALHPDQEAAIEEIVATLGAALGTEVSVRATARGYRVELNVASADEAAALARRIGR